MHTIDGTFLWQKGLRALATRTLTLTSGPIPAAGRCCPRDRGCAFQQQAQRFFVAGPLTQARTHLLWNGACPARKTTGGFRRRAEHLRAAPRRATHTHSPPCGPKKVLARESSRGDGHCGQARGLKSRNAGIWSLTLNRQPLQALLVSPSAPAPRAPTACPPPGLPSHPLACPSTGSRMRLQRHSSVGTGPLTPTPVHTPFRLERGAPRALPSAVLQMAGGSTAWPTLPWVLLLSDTLVGVKGPLVRFQFASPE